MKKFVVYIFLLTLPFLLLLPFPLYVFCVTGELSSFEGYLKPLNNNQRLGLAYFGYDREYKFYLTDEKKPDIIELGTSRSMQVPADIFNKKYSFYNAGVAAQNIRDLYTFVKKLSYNPQLIIIDVNQFWFNPRRKPAPEAKYDKPGIDYQNIFFSCFSFYRDIILGKINPFHLYDNDNIGVAGRFKQDGFDNTGFYHYESCLNNPEKAPDYNFQDTFDRIRSHNRRFETCNEIDRESIRYIKSFLDECKKRNILVLAFLPPYAPKVISMLKEDGNYEYLTQIYSALIPLFNNTTQFLYDYTDVKHIGACDNDFVDGYHAGEVVDILVFKDIVNKSDFLQQYFVSQEKMDSLIDNYHKKGLSYHNF